MADLGAIGYSLETPLSTEVDSITNNTSGYSGVLMFGHTQEIGLGVGRSVVMTSVNEHGNRLQTSTNYTIAGLVLESGVPKVGWLVRLYRRDNGVWLGDARTNGSGAFSFTVIGYNGEVTCVAYDDTGASPDYNAIVYDRVTPV
jgi:hypothetical protein